MQSETYLTPEQAADLFPGCPRRETVWRWARKGVKLRDGSTIFLEHVFVGGKVFIPESAVEPFIQAVTAGKQAAPPPRQPVVAPAQLDRARIDVAAILQRGRLV